MSAPPPSVDDAIFAIRAYARASGLTVFKIAQKSGLWKTTLARFWHPDWNPTATTLRILHAMVPANFDPRVIPRDLDFTLPHERAPKPPPPPTPSQRSKDYGYEGKKAPGFD